MQNNRSASLVKSSLAITVVLLLSKILSFARDMLLANYLGASELSDVFLASSGVLFLFTSFVRSPFATSYLPIATEHYLHDPEQGRSPFFGKIYGVALALGTIFLLAMLLFLRPLVELMVPGFSPEAKAQLTNLLFLQLPVVLFVMVSIVVFGNLQVLGHLSLVETSNGVIALVYVLYLLLFRHHITAAGLGLSTVAAYGASLFPYMAAAARGGIPLRLRRFSRKDPEIQEILLATLPFMLVSCTSQINSMVDRIVASLLDSGSVTIQSYASKMTVTEVGLISTAVSMVIFAQASRLSAEHDTGGLEELVSSGLKFVSFLVIPGCVGTILYRYEIITVLFGRGAFTQENEAAGHIDPHNLFELLRRRFEQGLIQLPRGVVDQNIEPPETAVDLIQHRENLLLVGDVAADERHPRRRSGKLRSALFINISDNHLCAVVRQTPHDGGSDSLGSPRDNCDFSL